MVWKRKSRAKPPLRQEDINVIDIISLGAGVQSSTLALMAARGEITPMPDCAIFADTGWEPQSVYDWLDWLETELPFPVYRVAAGDLGEAQLNIRVSKKTGLNYIVSGIPAFIEKLNGRRGMLGRGCTGDFKVVPIRKKIRELVGIKRGGAGVIRARVWMGISTDEAIRIKPSLVDFVENRWPLIDRGISREDCYTWMEKAGYPRPPRSACVFCPFHSDYEWARMKKEEPHEFQRAVAFEQRLQDTIAEITRVDGTPYLHGSLIPLGDITFDEKKKEVNLFGNDCDGMCGI